jgi:predicted nucleic acid-binding protein
VGDTGITSAVVDAGPLIHLGEIGALSLLRLFPAIYIPGAVWQEAVASGRVVSADLEILPNLHRCELLPESVTRFSRAYSLMHLHTGERESLYVCIQDNIHLLLTDDLAVRKAAKLLELTPVGSLGVIVRAYKMLMLTLSQAERYILDLQDVSSLFVTRAIVELALESLHH